MVSQLGRDPIFLGWWDREHLKQACGSMFIGHARGSDGPGVKSRVVFCLTQTIVLPACGFEYVVGSV